MNELTRVLWEYAVCRLEGCYDRDSQKERRECEEAVAWNWEQLEALCPSPVWKQVEALSGCLETIRSIDMEAAFICGLRLGQELR